MKYFQHKYCRATIQMLHEFTQSLTIELKEREKRTSAMTMQTKKEKVALKKQLEEVAKHRDDAIQ